MKPKFVIFDCDGVLVDSEHLTNQVIQKDLSKAGLDLSMDQLMIEFVGGTMSGVRTKAVEMGADLPLDWVEQVYKKIYAVLKSDVKAMDGIQGVLDFLDSQDIPYAVGSNGRMEKMKVTLGKTGLWDRLEGRLFSAQDISRPKPAPDLYLKIADQFNTRPENCAVIEDSASGAQAAFDAGMACYGFTKDTAEEKLAPYCAKLFKDMNELPTLLKAED